MSNDKLSTHVMVTDDDGAVHVFGPDDELPTWATEKIKRDDVWDDTSGMIAATVPSTQAEVVEDEAAPDARPQVPPGNASAEDWKRYAIALGADESDVKSKSRDELKAQYGG